MTTENEKLRKEVADANAALEHAERRLTREREAFNDLTQKYAEGQRSIKQRSDDHAGELRRANDGKIIAENNLRIERDNVAALASKLAAVEAQRNRLAVFTEAIRKALNTRHKTLRAEITAVRQAVIDYVPGGYAGISVPATNREPLLANDAIALRASSRPRIYGVRASIGSDD
jgi:DNA repair exonuclease SbcCD ATPase subunit